MEYFYRFRSIDNLLGQHQELEKQEIYFAHPEQLNDPMEGFIDVFWEGDSIVWTNLIRNYLLSLQKFTTLYILCEKTEKLSEDDITININEFESETPESELLFNSLFTRLVSNSSISKLINGFSKRKSAIRREELVQCFGFIHRIALDIIFSVYEENNLVPKDDVDKEKFEENKFIEHYLKIFTSPDIDESIGNIQEIVFSIINTHSEQLDLIDHYNKEPISLAHNEKLLIKDFPKLYIKKLEQFIYPEWYTACFMSTCHNSSVWGNYGNNHAGVCLKFKANKSDKGYCINLKHASLNYSHSMEFEKVNYTQFHVEIDHFRVIGQLNKTEFMNNWYTDVNGNISRCAKYIFDDIENWKTRYWDLFQKRTTSKLKDWEYENEYRLVFCDMLQLFDSPKDQIMKYDFDSLDGIIFGIKTTMENKLKIMKIIGEKCAKKNRSDFKFYQAFYNPEKGQIDHKLLSLLTPNKL